MRYIKTYETNSIEPFDINVGDYIMIYPKKIRNDIITDYKGLSSYDMIKTLNSFRWAISDDFKNNIVKVIKKDGNTYDVEFFNNRTWTIYNRDIKRKLTPDEIDKHELKIASKKYNI